MSIQPEGEILAMSSSSSEDDLLDPQITQPPSSPEDSELLAGRLPSFDDGVMGSRAWIKLVLWAYRLAPSTISAIPIYDEPWRSTDSPSLFRVTFPQLVLRNAFPRRLPLTAPITLYGVTSFLVKVKAGHDDPSHTNWVENEVAGMHIARHALARMKPSAAHVVPEVYAWHSEEHNPGSGCIIMQDKRGEPLSKLYGFMGSTSREGILETVAAFFAMFHNAPVPSGVRTYGGLTIDHVEPHHCGIGCAEGSDKTEKWHLVLDEVVSRLKSPVTMLKYASV